MRISRVRRIPIGIKIYLLSYFMIIYEIVDCSLKLNSKEHVFLHICFEIN